MNRTTLAVAAVATAVFATPAPGQNLRVRYENGLLSLSSRGVPAPEVFSAIADEAGVRFVIDKELKPASVTMEIVDMEIERAIRNVVSVMPGVAGHTMSYQNVPDGEPRLSQVSIYGPGKSSAGGDVYEATAPLPIPTPDLQERMDRMIEAGVPRETAEKVVELTAEVQRLQATPPPGSYSPDDLSEASREQLQPLIDRGVPMERAVQMLLLQEKYQDTLRDLSEIQGSVPGMPGLPGSAAGTPSEPQTTDPDQAASD